MRHSAAIGRNDSSASENDSATNDFANPFPITCPACAFLRFLRLFAALPFPTSGMRRVRALGLQPLKNDSAANDFAKILSRRAARK
jgi:hypothetical protein